MPVLPVIAMQRFDLKNSIKAIKLFIGMILKLLFILKVKRVVKVIFCGGWDLK